MTSNTKLSIVIPVYNVERYIEKCILSCTHQDIALTDYEIIVVNDGTKDHSLEIAERIAAGYSNVRIISQENQGLSVARNTGLKKTQGDYVWFVDADDWISENALSLIFLHLDGEVDYLQLSFFYAYDDNTRNRHGNTSSWNGTITGSELIKRKLLKVSSIPAQFAIYKRSLLIDNNLYFFPNVYYEDVEIKLRILNTAAKCKCLKDPVYYYYQRSVGSIKSSYKEKHALDAITVMNNLLNYSTVDKYSSSDTVHMYYYFIGLCMNMIMSGLPSLSLDEQNKIKNILSKNKKLFTALLKSSHIPYRIEGFLGYISVNFVLMYYKHK